MLVGYCVNCEYQVCFDLVYVCTCVRVCLCECACLFWVRVALVRGSIRPGGIGVLVSDKVAEHGQEGVAAFFIYFFF